MPRCCCKVLFGLTVLLAGATGRVLQAQNPPPQNPPAPKLPARNAAATLGPDSFLVVVPIRDTMDIKRDLIVASRARTQADHDRAQAERLKQSARARLARKDEEIDGIKRQQKVFKSQKRSVDAVALEADQKAAEQEKDLIERRASLRDAEIELERKRAEMLDARRQALELELQLTYRRLDQARAGNPGGPTGARIKQVLNDLEQRTLQMQQKDVEKSKEVADRQKEIIQKRLQILEAQRKFTTGS
jgi:hypothetical protein